jgi:hypothetical protein
MNKTRALTSLLACAVAAGALASVGSSTNASSARQRIAIVERVSLAGGKSTFELVPLSPGPLKHDIGTVGPGGEFTGYITRNGLRIQVGSGTDNLAGKQGSFRLTGSIEHVPIVGGYFVDSGEWTFSAGTGRYAGVSGGGRFVAVVLPSNRILARNEGYVRIG